MCHSYCIKWPYSHFCDSRACQSHNIQMLEIAKTNLFSCTNTNIRQCSTYFYVSTTIGGLLRELNVQWSLLARWRGEQTVTVTTEHSVPEEGRRWWSKRRSKSNIASCVIMKFVSNIIYRFDLPHLQQRTPPMCSPGPCRCRCWRRRAYGGG